MGMKFGPVMAMALAFGAAAAPARAYMAYVSNEKGNTITVIDTTTLAVVKTIKVGQRPRGIAVSKDGAQIFVCLGDDDTIRVVNAKTLEADGDLPSGPDPELLLLSADGSTVYLSNENDNMVTAIDVKTRKMLQKSPSGSSRRAWRSAPTASFWSIPPKPPTWRM